MSCFQEYEPDWLPGQPVTLQALNEPSLCTVQPEEPVLSSSLVLDIDQSRGPEREIMLEPDADELLDDLLFFPVVVFGLEYIRNELLYGTGLHKFLYERNGAHLLGDPLLFERKVLNDDMLS